MYLPDFKYMDPSSAKVYSRAEDYPEVANQMFLRQACVTIDEESFFLYRFLGGDEVCVDQSL